MESLNIIFDTVALLALNALFNNRLAYLLTDHKGPVFNFKPFNCRPCLTFWLTLIIGVVIAFALANEHIEEPYLFLIAALITAFINFYIVKSLIKVTQ